MKTKKQMTTSGKIINGMIVAAYVLFLIGMAYNALK